MRHTTIKQLSRNAYHKLINVDSPYIHVIKNGNGELLLHKGIEAYNKIKSSKHPKSIPVYITSIPNITELEWTYRLFQSCMVEKVNIGLNYEYITLLLKETKNDIGKICKNTGCTKQEIFNLIFDDTVPNKYRELAIQYNRRSIINEIAKNPKLQIYRPVLYRAAFQRKKQLTFEKLKLFLTYLEAGYQLNINSILALENFNKIVDNEEALTYYWNHLNFPDTQIIEGVFYYKGDKNSKINVRL